jgi:hypothetical protein
MKKRLEADLMSIAHRILQLKNKSDINQLYLETQQLYEKLSVLKFIDENYGDAKPTIASYSEIEKEVEDFYNKNTSLPIETQIEMTESNLHKEVEEPTEEATQEIAVPETTEEEIEEETATEENIEEKLDSVEIPETEDNSIEEVVEKTVEEEVVTKSEPKDEFKTSFELTPESEIEEPQKPEAVQISFEDLLGLNYNEPQFVKVEDVPAETAKDIAFEAVEKAETATQKTLDTVEKSEEKTTPKIVSLNDKFSKGIDIDLNDRIAFVKHLFGNSNEDYNRVMNQLITYDNFYETKNFIEEMVKPDYNDWKGKEEYEERFMDIIEKKFL